ncbi:methyl-CpG-binding domain protein 2-like isoform X2 [Mercenaria mercenaria]|uniref:methyl-CpG-binding domain protein 2-like isoform X2 n=1 Tax=Mercenaria mercenaria TaxID=6596 RepID=UPI00234EB985|nr:methyl-CpG-binding domain protein 2-like isoform X2 [Mercenaria mercenaria]
MDKRTGNVPGLPPGWSREECVRQCGLSAGKTDVFYISPDGVKIRSKPHLARYLGESFDLSAFDFRTGKIISSSHRKRMRQDANLALPIRQTASIFKQPVTVIRNHPDSVTKTDLKHGPQEPPRQLFWEKRLQGLKACDSTEELIQSLELPKTVLGIGPELTTENILQSISAALHLGAVPIIGQHSNKNLVQKNPGVHMDINQPHIQQLIVSDEDIKKQELKVTEARRKLQDIMKT